MVTKKDAAQLVKRLRAQGWRCELTRNNHWRLTPPDGGTPVFYSTTPSDWRGYKNVIAQLRRRGANL